MSKAFELSAHCIVGNVCFSYIVLLEAFFSLSTLWELTSYLGVLSFVDTGLLHSSSNLVYVEIKLLLINEETTEREERKKGKGRKEQKKKMNSRRESAQS